MCILDSVRDYPTHHAPPTLSNGQLTTENFVTRPFGQPMIPLAAAERVYEQLASREADTTVCLNGLKTHLCQQAYRMMAHIVDSTRGAK
jgi:hypothetical protein